MQFLADGPDIPTELLEAQERGEVVFVCGAGVSRAAGLPSFRGLVDDIYRAWDETWLGQPAEEPHLGEPPALDRALFAFQSRIGGSDARTAALARGRTIAAVQASLAPPAGGQVRDHLNILRLSRDAEHRRRVVTTNFDTLFERAWRNDGRGDLPSRAAADMPGPGTADFVGVLHLHGRIADDDLGLARTDLVLNSAEFGDAYLRSGWAARYVYDLARASTIVIVGYGAEDPPVRYLLEVLSADRSRFRDLGEIYAFSPCGIEPLGPRAAVEARWKIQGITPLCYDVADMADHGGLYGTLAAWADYADDPTAWRRAQARALMDRPPEDMTEPDWVTLRWALGRGDAARVLSETNPDPIWFAPLRANGLLDGAQPSAWIERRLAEREMLEAVLQPQAINRVTAEDLQFTLGRVELPADYERAWRLLLRNRSATRQAWDEGWFDIRRRIQRADTGLDLRRQVVRLLTPSAEAHPVFRWPEEIEAHGDPRLMDVRYRGPSHANLQELIELWPADHDALLLRPLVRMLEDALEEADDHGFAGGGFDRASFQVKSVARHGQDSLREGFYSIVRVIADLMERLDGREAAPARAVAEQLAASPLPLARRLHIHALTLPNLFTAAEAAAVLLHLDDEQFWLSDLRREVMRLTALRWTEFEAAAREALERRMIAGPPRNLFVDDPGMAEQVAGVMERETFLRLARQEGIAPGLGAAAEARVAELRAANPRWEASVDERADFSSWSEMRYGEQGEPELLDEVDKEELVERAAAIAEADPMGQGEIWRKFVSADPARAFDGLVARAEAGEWPAHAWIPYFWGISEVDNPELERRTVAFLNEVPPEHMLGFGFAASGWVVRRNGLPCVVTAARLRLWDRLVNAMIADPREAERDGGDREFDVLNRTPGHLSRWIVHEIAQLGLQPGAGIPEEFRHRLERLTELEGDRGGIAVAAMVRNLPFLYDCDSVWTDERLLPFFAVEHEWAPSMWAQLVRVDTWSPELFAVLKPAFLGTFSAAPRFATASENLVYHLVRMARDRVVGAAPQPWPTLPEAKAALASATADYRQNAAFRLFRELEDTDVAERPAVWRNTIGPLFQAVWPMAPARQSAGATYYLAAMALRTGDAFPEAVSVVTPALIGAGSDDRDAFAMLRDEHEDLLLLHPDAALSFIDALVHREHPPRELGTLLDQLAETAPDLCTDVRFVRLLGIARRAQA